MTAPYWMAVARKYVGVTEVPGPKADPTIMGWARRLGGFVASFVKDDLTPWCAIALNGILDEAGLPLSAKRGSADLMRAKSFLHYGTPLEAPALGAILVFARPGGYHVGLYEGETLKAYRVLGGNQSDAFNATWIAQDRCVAIRWPDASVIPGPRLWLRPDSSPFSLNER